ncbi:MAG: 23S rRNA (uracil(1939)-C(5))-methyltransferase RlmD [Spirochaetota bacterium]
MELTIEKLGGEGVSIARAEGKTVFVPFGVPGDVVKAEIREDKRTYCRASITEVITPSPDRVAAPCRYFGDCGGCAHQNISYEAQCRHKHALLTELFRAIATPVDAVVPSPSVFGYRSKMQLQCARSGSRILAGFYRSHSRSLVPIDRCPLHTDEVNALARTTVRLLNDLRLPAFDARMRKGLVRDIVIRSNTKGESMLTLVIHDRDFEKRAAFSKAIFRRHPSLAGFFTFHNPRDTEYVFADGENITTNTRHSPLEKVYGKAIDESFAGMRFALSPLTFFQVNVPQAQRIAAFLAECFGHATSAATGGLIDAHAGVGAFSLALAPKFTEVLAVELVRDSCELAIQNVRMNRVPNVRVRHSSDVRALGEILSRDGMDRYPNLLLDPPRAGLSEDMRAMIPSMQFKRIVYVSCNPHTQARDAAVFTANGYRVTRIAPFDMFPHTYHIECVMVFERS